ncbi:MAG: polysaccharide deacetylase family protein [Prosthecobacter sp.]
MQLVRTLAFFIFSTACVAQTTATAVAEPEPQIEIRKAIPVVETAPAITAKPPAKIVFTNCKVPGPVIAITFDDGPNPDTTPRLLDMLKERNIKATFFMVGRCVVTYPQIVKRIADEGHEVANHSWSHPLLTALGTTSVDSQLQRTHDAIVKACGKTPMLYRPPYGEARLSQRKRIQETFGYPTILWDVDPLDWQHPRSFQKVHDRILSQTKSGSIILCHDIHETTVNAMPSTLDDLKARGYQFATVTQLIQLEAESAKLSVPVVLQPAVVQPFSDSSTPITLSVPTETKLQ